ncbi:hypothetical protein STEG23_029693 [Scotinomys teguina]
MRGFQSATWERQTRCAKDDPVWEWGDSQAPHDHVLACNKARQKSPRKRKKKHEFPKMKRWEKPKPLSKNEKLGSSKILSIYPKQFRNEYHQEEFLPTLLDGLKSLPGKNDGESQEKHFSLSNTKIVYLNPVICIRPCCVIWRKRKDLVIPSTYMADLMPSSGLHEHQTQTWYTVGKLENLHEGNVDICKQFRFLFHNLVLSPPSLLPETLFLCCLENTDRKGGHPRLSFLPGLGYMHMSTDFNGESDLLELEF